MRKLKFDKNDDKNQIEWMMPFEQWEMSSIQYSIISKRRNVCKFLDFVAFRLNLSDLCT